MVWRLYRLIAERVWHQVNNHGELERKGLFCSYELFVESAQQVTLQLIAEARQVAFQTSELFFCKREFSTMRDPNPPHCIHAWILYKNKVCGIECKGSVSGESAHPLPPLDRKGPHRTAILVLRASGNIQLVFCWLHIDVEVQVSLCIDYIRAEWADTWAILLHTRLQAV